MELELECSGKASLNYSRHTHTHTHTQAVELPAKPRFFSRPTLRWGWGCKTFTGGITFSSKLGQSRWKLAPLRLQPKINVLWKSIKCCNLAGNCSDLPRPGPSSSPARLTAFWASFPPLSLSHTLCVSLKVDSCKLRLPRAAVAAAASACEPRGGNIAIDR